MQQFRNVVEIQRLRGPLLTNVASVDFMFFNAASTSFLRIGGRHGFRRRDRSSGCEDCVSAETTAKRRAFPRAGETSGAIAQRSLDVCLSLASPLSRQSCESTCSRRLAVGYQVGDWAPRLRPSSTMSCTNGYPRNGNCPILEPIWCLK